MKKIFAIALMFGLTACETVDGVGQDLSKAGQAISKTAK